MNTSPYSVHELFLNSSPYSVHEVRGGGEGLGAIHEHFTLQCT